MRRQRNSVTLFIIALTSLSTRVLGDDVAIVSPLESFKIHCVSQTGFQMERTGEMWKLPAQWQTKVSSNLDGFQFEKLTDKEDNSEAYNDCKSFNQFQGLGNTLKTLDTATSVVLAEPTGGCYKVSKDSEVLEAAISCTEYWGEVGGVLQMFRVDCAEGGFKFEPNGRFQMSTLSNYWSTEGRQSKSLNLGFLVGVCSTPEIP